MSLPPEGQAVLVTAEHSLRALVEEAARNGRYGDVVELAEAAQALRQLMGHSKSLHQTKPADLTNKPPAGARVRATKRSTAAKQAEFPKFEVDGDRLVKIGWSKREKSEYQHKASREVALCTYLKLGAGATAEPFRMDDQFPIRMADGADVPTYQSYLVLAWLRQLGYIEKVGKDSYQWVDMDIDEASFKRAWESTIRS